MKFNKATSKLISETDMTRSGIIRNGTVLSEATDDVKIDIMKKMGANDDIIARWKIAESRDITFESFLLGLVDELNNE